MHLSGGLFQSVVSLQLQFSVSSALYSVLMNGCVSVHSGALPDLQDTVSAVFLGGPWL